MYQALAIGLSDSLLSDLQSLLQQHLQLTAATTLHAANRFLSEIAFHLLIVDLEYLRNIQQIH